MKVPNTAMALAAAITISIFAFRAHAQRVIVETESSITFEISNHGSIVAGSIGGLEGRIDLDPKQPAASSFDVTVSTKTIQTGNRLRDFHLKREGYLNASSFPTIRYVSDKIDSKGSNWQVVGKITIKGITKPASIPFVVTEKGERLVLMGEFYVSREEFEIGSASTVMSDSVLIKLVVATKNK